MHFNSKITSLLKYFRKIEKTKYLCMRFKNSWVFCFFCNWEYIEDVYLLIKNKMLDLIYKYPEVTIILINLFFIIVTYWFIYPKFVKDNLNKLTLFDLFFSIFSLVIAWIFFYWKDINFFLVWKWYFFSIGIYFILEIILFLDYSNRYKIDLWNNNIK